MEFGAESATPPPPFRILNTLTHCLLPFKISDEKSADILIEDPFSVCDDLLLSCCFHVATPDDVP